MSGPHPARPAPDPDGEPARELLHAILADDPARAGALLGRSPALRARLDEPLPDQGFGTTALLLAVQRGSRDMVDVLLRAGADINARSRWWAGGFGVLDDDHGLAEFLVSRGARVDAHAAARLGWTDVLRERVAADPGVVNARGGDGQTPLHFACSAEVAGFLLDHGADIDARDVDHESTPAQWMMRDRREVARYLVSRGCRTDLLMLSALGDLEGVRRLLDEDPSRIHVRVSPEHFPMADPRAGGCIYTWTLGMHRTPHRLARDAGHRAVLGLLLERSPGPLRLALAPELGDADLFRQLLASDPGLVGRLSPEQRRKVVDAAQDRDLDAVRMMLEAGWPVDARGRHGGTALHWAAFHGHAEMARLVLGFGPPLEAVDDDFNATPLGWAMHGSREGWYRDTGDYAGTVRAILRAGARPPAKPGGSAAVQAVLREAGAQPSA